MKSAELFLFVDRKILKYIYDHLVLYSVSNEFCKQLLGPLLLTWFNFNPSMDM